MSRPVFVGNGSMMVGLDHRGCVQDFYYPYVGLEDHVSNKSSHHRVGIWIDGKFSWFDGPEWRIESDYEGTAQIGVTQASSERYQIDLEMRDFVDPESNVFCRDVKVTNRAERQREVRLFMHQVFFISASIRGDTAAYLPKEHVLMHYKGRRVFMVYAQTDDGQPFDQYSIGVHGIEGKEGTYRDAEDGELSGNAVEHGKVDSTIRLSLEIDRSSSRNVHYWVAVAGTRVDALKIHQIMLNKGLPNRYQYTQKYWKKWLDQSSAQTARISPEYKSAFNKSLLIIKSHIDRRGSILASGDSEMLNYERDNYSYFWPRDGAFVIWPLIRLGYTEEAKAFFEFCRDVISPEGYLMHKYQPDRALGSSWHPYVRNNKAELPIQEDETAITIFMISQYLKFSNDEDFVRNLYPTLIRPAANFMDSFIDSSTKLPHASYDLWEEKFLTTTYSTAIVYAGLIAASKLAERFEYPDDAIRWQTVAEDIRSNAREVFFNHETNYFHKGFLLNQNDMLEFDPTIDTSSLYGAVMFGLYDSDDDYVKRSVETLKRELVNRPKAGGVPRYLGDRYRTSSEQSVGNPWPVTSLWYAQFLIDHGQKEAARKLVDWVMSLMLKSGVLPEQVDANNGSHMDIAVAPLIWSQAEFVNTIIDLS